MKKLLSLILTSALLLCSVPFGIMADESTLPFIDVNDNDWFFDAVKYSYDNGIFKGTNSDGTEFSPTRKMTRAEFATTLFRLSGANAEAFEGNTGFSDVPAGKWMSAAVKWAAEMGYVKGTGANKFNPNGTLDRQQLATMLYRFVGASFDTTIENEAILDSFDDGDTVASWAAEAMTWAANEMLLKGNDKGLLVPANSATRSQVAQILLNFSVAFEGSDSTGLVNSDLVFAINNIKYTEPKNYIFMIGDGMGFNIVEMTEYLYKDQLYDGKLAMNYIPRLSCHTSYSQDNQTTDSAAGGTALSTGYKTANGTVAMDYECTRDYMTILELAATKGKSTGVIATKSVTDATPAAFTAHVNSRYEHEVIARQQLEAMIEGELDLILGGGRDYYTDGYNSDRLNQAVRAGQVNYSDRFDYSQNDPLPMLGLYSTDAMDTFDETLPTLAEMTDLALDRLSEDDNGFFLMVEGSQIDTYAHNNDLEKSAHETFEFDKAIAVVLNFIKDNPDTVLIITADHETGGLIIPEELDETNDDFYLYLTGSHSYRNVPVYALGYGVEAIDKTNENTDLPIFMAALMGEENFGIESEIYTLVDMTDTQNTDAIIGGNTFGQAVEGGLELNFNINDTEFDIPVSVFDTDREQIKNVRAIHVEYTNLGDSYCVIPSMYIGYEFSDPHLEYLNPGETQIVSYIIPSLCWEDYVFADNDSFGLYIAEPFFHFDSYDSDLLVGDITVTVRDLAN